MKQELQLAQALKALNLEALLAGLRRVRMAVIGDMCLDVYWHADMRRSELSRETPHYPLPVTEERFSPGGAANVCANAAALGVAEVRALGVVGDDWRGAVLRRCFRQQGILDSALAEEAGRITNAYCKPIRHGISDVAYEDPRLDFADSRPLGRQTEQRLLSHLRTLDADVLCVSDQLKHGCITPAVREQILLLGRQGMRIVADSRDRIALYPGVIRKPNEVEGYRAVHGALPPEDAAPDLWEACALALAEDGGTDVFMTLGARGCIHARNGMLTYVGAAVPPEAIDFVGAGDTVLASLAAALAAGAAPAEAMAFANLCASITIGKIGTTGTATPDEIRAAARRQTLTGGNPA